MADRSERDRTTQVPTGPSYPRRMAGPDEATQALEVDRESLLELARGANLYGARFAFLRELLQNAVDATLLRIFVERPNRVLSRDTLVDLLKGYERDPFDRSVDVRVARLRSKVEEDSREPRYIRTVWGQGYLFAPDGDAR